MSKRTVVTAAPAVESAPTVKKFAVTILETEQNVGRAFVVKCDSVARLIDAFQITVEELGKQVALKPLMFPSKQPEDAKKAQSA